MKKTVRSATKQLMSKNKKKKVLPPSSTKIKSQFWAVLFRYEPFRLGPSSTASYTGPMYFPYRYKVEGFKANTYPGLEAFEDILSRFNLFAHKVGSKWHLHEESSGIIVSEAETIYDAVEAFGLKLIALDKEAKKYKSLKSLSDQISELPYVENNPTMETSEALGILLRKEEEVRAKRRVKKELKLQKEASVENRSPDRFEPRSG